MALSYFIGTSASPVLQAETTMQSPNSWPWRASSSATRHLDLPSPQPTCRLWLIRFMLIYTRAHRKPFPAQTRTPLLHAGPALQEIRVHVTRPHKLSSLRNMCQFRLLCLVDPLMGPDSRGSGPCERLSVTLCHRTLPRSGGYWSNTLPEIYGQKCSPACSWLTRVMEPAFRDVFNSAFQVFMSNSNTNWVSNSTTFMKISWHCQQLYLSQD